MEGNEWDGRLAAIAAILTALGGVILALHKWFSNGRSLPFSGASKEKRDDPEARVVSTLFQLIEEHREELERKSRQIEQMESANAARIGRLDARITALEQIVESQAETILTLRQALRDLRAT